MGSVLVALGSFALASEPACTSSGTSQGFADAALAAEVAFARIDRDALDAASEAAAAALGCISEPIGAPDAAAFHRLRAMVAFVDHDFVAVQAEFHAARRLEPGYVIPPSVAPSGHPLVSLYEASLVAAEGDLQPVQAPGGGWILVDGVRGAARPSRISVLVQGFDPDGRLAHSAWLPVAAPLPDWATPPPPVSRKGLHRGLLTGTALALTTSAALYGAAFSTHESFWNLDDPVADAELRGVGERANTLTWASAGAGVVAVGLGTVTVVTW